MRYQLFISATVHSLFMFHNEWLSFASSGKLNVAMSGTRNNKWTLCCTNARILEIVCTFQMAFIHKNKMLPRWSKWRNKNMVQTSVRSYRLRQKSFDGSCRKLSEAAFKRKMNRNFTRKKIKKIYTSIAFFSFEFNDFRFFFCDQWTTFYYVVHRTLAIFHFHHSHTYLFFNWNSITEKNEWIKCP